MAARVDILYHIYLAMASGSIDPVEILADALRSPGSQTGLDNVRRNRKKITEVIDSGSTALPDVDNLDPSWVAHIAAVLDEEAITDEAFRVDSSRISPEMSWQESEAQIGTRFAAIVRSLPGHLRRFEAFTNLPLVDAKSRQAILASPACVAAESVGVDLAEYGLSPLTFIGAAQGVARALRKGMRRQRQSGVEVYVTADEQIAGIAAFCRVDKVVARRILIWLQRASEYSSDIIPGFVARMNEKHLFFGKSAAALEAKFRQDRTQDVAEPFYEEYNAEH